MAGRAKENLPGGSLKYRFVYLKVRIFKCSYRIYIYIYIHIFRKFQCHNADDKTDFSWHRSNWPEKWRWQNERPNPETLDQWTFDDSMVIWPGHSRNFCSSQVFPWMFEYHFWTFPGLPRTFPGIPIFGATPGQAVEFTTLAEAGLLRFHELQKLQPWNRLPTRLDLKTKSQKFASFHLGLQNRIPMDTSKTVDHHVLMEVAQNVGPPKSSKSLAFVLVLKAMVNPPF